MSESGIRSRKPGPLPTESPEYAEPARQKAEGPRFRYSWNQGPWTRRNRRRVLLRTRFPVPQELPQAFRPNTRRAPASPGAAASVRTVSGGRCHLYLNDRASLKQVHGKYQKYRRQKPGQIPPAGRKLFLQRPRQQEKLYYTILHAKWQADSPGNSK